MFSWNVEELTLLKAGYNYKQKEKMYLLEKDVSRNDKIAFVDTFHGGNLSYLVALLDKYTADKERLPKDKCGCVWTNSLRKWLRNNDERKLVDDKVWHGKYVFLGMERFVQLDLPGRGDIYTDLVDECFHRQILWCLEQEKAWFKEHDEYYITAKKLADFCDMCQRDFCNRTHISSAGIVYKKDLKTGEKTLMTLEEVKLLLSYCEQIKMAAFDKNNELLHNIFCNKL